MMPGSISAIKTTARLQGSIPLWERTIQKRFLKSMWLLCDIEDEDIIIIISMTWRKLYVKNVTSVV